MANERNTDAVFERMRQSYEEDMRALEQREDDAKHKVSQLEEAHSHLEEIMYKMSQQEDSPGGQGCDMSQIAPLIEQSRNEVRLWLEVADAAIDETRQEQRQAARQTEEREDQFRRDVRTAQTDQESYHSEERW